MNNIDSHYDTLYKSNSQVKNFNLIKYCLESNKQYLNQINDINLELELTQVQKNMDLIKKYNQEIEDKKKLLIDFINY
ncbi:hypothetical protein [Megavirus chiliensis]|uniref:Uncharacterized protein n=2 Tax=Megamimivirinae TaxID=3044648 RepID=A0A2L2DM29_MIMIV|nr:hypothetical protein MegaChil _gp0384 [Megavirus chiliensis]AEQ32934.1 hypothetical protein [Megavirus chiliensis]AVG47221.1 hypothetical protein [Acanthamoeba polyphaga mimivirus]